MWTLQSFIPLCHGLVIIVLIKRGLFNSVRRDDHGNFMGMEIDDTIGNGKGNEWESPCVRMGMTHIRLGINFHRRVQYHSVAR